VVAAPVERYARSIGFVHLKRDAGELWRRTSGLAGQGVADALLQPCILSRSALLITFPNSTGQGNCTAHAFVPMFISHRNTGALILYLVAVRGKCI